MSTPSMDPGVARIESAIEAAARRGDFDDLPGAGKPLDLPDTHDPDWWVNQRIASGDIDSEALLPVVVSLRKEYERRDETLAASPDEKAVREYARGLHRARPRGPAREPLPADAGAGVGRGRRGRALASGAGSGSRCALGHLRAGRRAADPAPAVVALRPTGWAGVRAVRVLTLDARLARSFPDLTVLPS
ncbi:DUF1992 domain-containing protein [Brachybacterium sp. GPGPB12]|uniref:DnaJ family domain-containing protein n=1 Tax=Brachybacterium sp. GPGPB12 TaxID=3023517 RepID=UPI00313462AA